MLKAKLPPVVKKDCDSGETEIGQHIENIEITCYFFPNGVVYSKWSVVLYTVVALQFIKCSCG